MASIDLAYHAILPMEHGVYEFEAFSRPPIGMCLKPKRPFLLFLSTPGALKTREQGE